MNNLLPITLMVLLTLTACTSTDSDKKNSVTNNKSEKIAKASKKTIISKKKKETDAEISDLTLPKALKPVTVVTPPTTQSKQIAGLYFARLPCPGCGSVRVNLMLEPNFTYDKTEEYLASNDIFFDSGTWTVKEGKVMLFPNPTNQETQSTIRLFHYSNGQLTLLTAQGKPFSDKSGDYLFKKK